MKSHALIFSCNNTLVQRLGGGYRIATFLREEHDWDVEVIEYAIAWKIEELKELCKMRIHQGTLFIGFSTLFYFWENNLDQLVNWLKIEYPDIPIVIGGPQCQRVNASADYFVNGYGENAIVELMKYIHGNSTEEIKLDPDWLRHGKKVIRQEYYPSYPLKSLLIKYEDRDFILEDEWLPIEFSRGCIFECKFCNFPILGVKSDYSRDAEDFERHVKDIYDRFGASGYYVGDETFNDSIPKMSKFADVVDRLNFRPTFSGFIRADLMVARKEDRELLLRMGFIGHYYGLETTNPETGKIIGKGMHPDKLLPGMLEIRDYFKKQGPYRGELSLVVGLPKETEESAMRGVNWVLENWRGECAHIWPFELPADPMYDKPNLISKNKEKYGYRLSNVESYEHTINEEVKHVTKTYNWQNDHFNFSRAQEFCINANKAVEAGDNRAGAWSIGDYMTKYKDINKVLELPQAYPIGYPEEIVENYKNRKFNL
jgi:radical SAM superfamily enzyme YgiQ (UPF0313 family)